MAAENEIIMVYGTHWCGDCKRSTKYLDSQGISYTWVDIEHDPEAIAYVQRVNGGMRRVPTIVFPDGSVLVEPSNAQLAAKLGIGPRS